jgi:hypothetical protein
MPEGRPRIEKSPKKRIKKEKTKPEKKIAKLDRPLSELTKGWDHVPVADIEAYVNRSAEERRREVADGKIPGKVKRPMNSFMLYRKAYQNRTKDWCLQNNHQDVSQVCGDSWPLEPDEIKEQFSEWARIERINHQNAHPGYKFTPTKPNIVKGSTKRKVSEDPLSEESDLDDFDWQTSTRTKKLRGTPRPSAAESRRPVVYPSTRSAYQYSSRGNSMEPIGPGYNKSSYQASNPNRPLPPQYSQDGLHVGQYYQQTVQGHPDLNGVEDVIIRKQAAPGMHSYLGLPGAGHEFDLMSHNAFSHYGSPPPFHEHKIDPLLESQGSEIYESGGYGEERIVDPFFGNNQNGEHYWTNQQHYEAIDHLNSTSQYIESIKAEEDMPIMDPHLHILKGHQEGWHVESLNEGHEFDKWMDVEPSLI